MGLACSAVNPCMVYPTMSHDAIVAPGLDRAIRPHDRTEVYRRFAPAYSYGWREHLRRGRARWEDYEAELAAGWRHVVNAGELSWEEVRGAVRAGWEHVSH